MIRDDTDSTETTLLRMPTCVACGNPMRYFVIDRLYCSYECAGIPVPDSRDHPASCWTWDGKPKMGFSTPEAAKRMCMILALEGVTSYYCPIHHFWHVGYSDGEDTPPPKEVTR